MQDESFRKSDMVLEENKKAQPNRYLFLVICAKMSGLWSLVLQYGNGCMEESPALWMFCLRVIQRQLGIW